LSDKRGGWRRHRRRGCTRIIDQVEKLCADTPPRGSITLDPEAIHLLSNHLAVIVGFVELMLADAAPGSPHFNDLVEIRAAAVSAANLVNRGQGSGGSWQ
jgi:hypothetical protein